MRFAPGPSNRVYGAILALSSKKKFNRKKKKVAYRLKEEYRVPNCANQSRLAGIPPNIGSCELPFAARDELDRKGTVNHWDGYDW